MNIVRPRILGHRGAILPSRGFQQNSLPAFQEAVEAADGFETDACASRDGQVFLIHEAKYVDAAKGAEYCASDYLDAPSRAALGPRRIDQLSAAELRALRLSDGSSLPTLEGALQFFYRRPDKLLNIELKARDAAEAVLPVLGAALADGTLEAKSLVLSSFDHASLSMVRARLPQIALGAIFMSPDQATTPLYPWHPDASARYVPLSRQALMNPRLQALRPEYVVIPEQNLRPGSIAAIAAEFPWARVIAWAFTEKNDFDLEGLRRRIAHPLSMERLAALIVDDPRRIAAALRSATG